MTDINDLINDFATLKAHLTAESPQTIRERLAAWAFEEAETIQEAIDDLERIDCAACFAPAPIYYHDMARELAEDWLEVDETLHDYREQTGEAWTPKPGASFLKHLWFAYEWQAHQLAGELRAALDR